MIRFTFKDWLDVIDYDNAYFITMLIAMLGIDIASRKWIWVLLFVLTIVLIVTDCVGRYFKIKLEKLREQRTESQSPHQEVQGRR